MDIHRLESLMEIAYVCTQKRSLHDVTGGATQALIGLLEQSRQSTPFPH